MTRRRSRTCCTERQLEDEGDPGQQPSAEALGKHCPFELSSSSSACLYALTIGNIRGTRLAGFVRDLGSTLVQSDRAHLGEQKEQEYTGKPKSDCGYETRWYLSMDG